MHGETLKPVDMSVTAVRLQYYLLVVKKFPVRVFLIDCEGHTPWDGSPWKHCHVTPIFHILHRLHYESSRHKCLFGFGTKTSYSFS